LSKIDFSSPLPSERIRIEPRLGENPIEFHLGEKILGTVLEQIDDRHAIVQLKGHPQWVETHLPLSKNMEGHFRVEATHPQVILRLIPEEEMRSQQIEIGLKNYLSSFSLIEDLSQKLLDLYELGVETISPSVRETAEHLLVLLRRFSFPSPFSLDPHSLQEIIVQSGLFFEHRLRQLIETHTKDQCDQVVRGDLKALMEKLEFQLKSSSIDENHPEKTFQTLDEAVKGLDQLLNQIKEYQILNLNPSRPQGRYFLLFPLWFQNHLQFVEMNLSLPQPGEGHPSPEEISILFLLQMPGWGRIGVEVKMKGKYLSCQFNVSDPEVCDFLRSAFPELNNRLTQIGFQSQLTISIESLENIAQALFSERVAGTESFLNVIV
jgi:hypothetical protein